MQLPAFRQKQFLRILLAWLLPIPACLLQWAFHAEVGPSPWLLFLPVLIFAPIIGGLWGGLGATLISALLAWYIFLPPAFSFAAGGLGLSLSVFLFASTGIVYSLVYDRLRDRNRQYRLLFDRAGDGIVRISRQGVFLDANDRFAAILQRTRRQLIGTPVTSVSAGLTPQVWDDIGRRLQVAGELSEQRQLRRADGELVLVEATVTMLHGGEYLVIVRDISERQQAEAALRESEAKFTKLFHASPVPLSLADLESGKLVDANDAFVAQYGDTRAELIGRSPTEVGLFSATTCARLREELERQGRLQGVDVQITPNRAKCGIA